MGIVGPCVGYAIYRLLKGMSVNVYVTVFLATALADLFTYVVTSFELALAYPAAVGGFGTSFVMFMAIFAVTQVPLAIVEGIVLALVFKYIIALKPDILIRMKVFSEARINAARGDA
jgi:cobalt/nickel transport system permease protein